MDGNLVGTVYYNFGEVADWQNEPTQERRLAERDQPHVRRRRGDDRAGGGAGDPANRRTHRIPSARDELLRIHAVRPVDRRRRTAGGRFPDMRRDFRPAPPRATIPDTWPAHWPDRPADWDGYWNGFFGKGVQNADLETYFVFDDNEDREYILQNNFHPDARRLHPRRTRHAGACPRIPVVAGARRGRDLLVLRDHEHGDDRLRRSALSRSTWTGGSAGTTTRRTTPGDYNKLLNISYAWSTVSVRQSGPLESRRAMRATRFSRAPGSRTIISDNDHGRSHR